MGVFDEFERRRTRVSRGQPRRPWPLSARLLAGAMIVLNILLVAFIVRTETKRPGAPGTVAPATSTPPSLEGPKTAPLPQVNTPVDQEAPADHGASLDLKTSPLKASPAALPSTHLPKTQRSGRHAIKALRAKKAARPVLRAPMPQAGVHPPQEHPAQTPTAVRGPAASSGASAPAASPALSANVALPRLAAPVGNPGAGVPGKAASPVIAPAPLGTGHGLTAKGARPGSTNRVASVGLPSMETGLVKPKLPVATVSPKIEIVHRPAGKVENCGDDDTFVACPTLHTRPEGAISSEDK